MGSGMGGVAGTRLRRNARDRSRMLRAMLLALCLDAVLLLIVGLWPIAPAPDSTTLDTSTLSVRLGASDRAPSSVPAVTAARKEPPAALPAALRDLLPAAVPMLVDAEPASLLTLGVGAQAAAADAAAGVGEAAAGVGEAAEPGPGSEQLHAARAELVRHIDALVRERMVYPPLARKRNIEGVVRITLLIDEHGRLDGSSLVHGSGSSILDKAAISLVEEIFPINLAGGLEEPVHLSIMISYSLTS
jgi:TonB family protein